jgi:hypothetical protein
MSAPDLLLTVPVLARHGPTEKPPVRKPATAPRVVPPAATARRVARPESTVPRAAMPVRGGRPHAARFRLTTG